MGRLLEITIVLVVIGSIITTGMVVHSKRVNDRVLTAELRCVFDAWKEVRLLDKSLARIEDSSGNTGVHTAFTDGGSGNSNDRFVFPQLDGRTRVFLYDLFAPPVKSSTVPRLSFDNVPCVKVLGRNALSWVFSRELGGKSIVEFDARATASVPWKTSVFFHNRDFLPEPAKAKSMYALFEGVDFEAVVWTGEVVTFTMKDPERMTNKLSSSHTSFSRGGLNFGSIGFGGYQ